MRLPDAAALADHSQRSLAVFNGIVTQQAAVITYSNDFLLMTVISLVTFPFVLMMSTAENGGPSDRRGRREPSRRSESMTKRS